MHSCLYEGSVSHRRYEPVEHGFRYRLYMAYLDLEEFDKKQLRDVLKEDRFSSASFLRTDHFGNSKEPLSKSIRELIQMETGLATHGPIRLLTQLRIWGYYFSPLNIYYCFQRDGLTPSAIVAEVSNTPWMERHMYVLWQGNQTQAVQPLKYRHPKAFHVSPFMAMEQIYDWSIGLPKGTLQIGIKSTHDEQLLFSAALTLKRQGLDRPVLRTLQIRYPLLAVKTVAAIYLQAFQLWNKNCPFYPHPKKDKRRQSKLLSQTQSSQKL